KMLGWKFGSRELRRHDAVGPEAPRRFLIRGRHHFQAVALPARRVERQQEQSQAAAHVEKASFATEPLKKRRPRRLVSAHPAGIVSVDAAPIFGLVIRLELSLLESRRRH